MKILQYLILSIILITSSQGRDPLDKPNIIIIYLDDSGYGDYAHNGNPVIETPTISKLSHQGVNFTQFYVASPACSASRYSLLTGRYPGRSSLAAWVIGPMSKSHMLPQEITLADGLKSVGYKTGMFGKWHLGTPNKNNQMTPDSLPLAHGFETWVGTNVSHDYSDVQLIKSDPNGKNPIKGYSLIANNLPSNPTVSTSLTQRYTDAAVSFIKENKDSPFFAYIAHNQPHLGLYASEQFTGKSRRGLLGDVMAEIDASLNSIVTTLEEEGISSNTLIIFSSDNGPWLKYRNTKHSEKYGEARLHVGYATPFRDGKGSNWEGGHRVPGIFYWPGVIEPDRQLEPISTLDVLPTVFSLAGASIPNDRTIDGRDIRPLLSPKLSSSKVAPFEFFYSYASNNITAVRKGPWKLFIQTGSQLKKDYGFKASKKTPLLFNVEQDISERINRAAEHPEIVKELLDLLEKKQQQIKKEGSIKK